MAAAAAAAGDAPPDYGQKEAFNFNDGPFFGNMGKVVILSKGEMDFKDYLRARRIGTAYNGVDDLKSLIKFDFINRTVTMQAFDRYVKFFHRVVEQGLLTDPGRKDWTLKETVNVFILGDFDRAIIGFSSDSGFPGYTDWAEIFAVSHEREMNLWEVAGRRRSERLGMPKWPTGADRYGHPHIIYDEASMQVPPGRDFGRVSLSRLLDVTFSRQWTYILFFLRWLSDTLAVMSSSSVRPFPVVQVSLYEYKYFDGRLDKNYTELEKDTFDAVIRAAGGYDKATERDEIAAVNAAQKALVERRKKDVDDVEDVRRQQAGRSKVRKVELEALARTHEPVNKISSNVITHPAYFMHPDVASSMVLYRAKDKGETEKHFAIYNEHLDRVIGFAAADQLMNLVSLIN